jgi:myo-inositol-1(or 4)-monophosphatase
MTNWLSFGRQVAEDVGSALRDLPSRLEREPSVGEGEGGDETTAIDAAAERAVVARLEALHEGGARFTLVSEELGERSFGAESPRLVLDPIDGSMNAKRGIPFFSVSLAVADGPTMADVFFGYVFDFGSGEEWVARRGEGAFLDGSPLAGPGPKEEIEILSFEATRTDLVAEQVAEMVGFAYRTRIMGSLALSLCHLAAGRVDAVCSLKAARSVDIAAAQLLVRERGVAIDLPDRPPFAAAPLDLSPHSRVVAAASAELCAELYRRLSSSPSRDAPDSRARSATRRP